jgi:aryl-alcohol dehydrogenase-like predicted oxidoreductase
MSDPMRVAALSRMGLGTAQFGGNYGISNRHGRPSEAGVAAILARTVEAGFGVIDTAPSYGETEAFIGRHLPSAHGLRIVTKTSPVQASEIGHEHKQELLDTLGVSLDRLRADHVHALLVHHASDLAKPGWEYIVDGLAEARSRGLVRRIGASVYGADDLALVLLRLQPELVQLALNVLDRRLIHAGWLPRLKTMGIEIHARSIFLQGLLLMRPADLPDFFSPVRTQLARVWQQWGRQGVSALAGCMAIVLQQREIDTVIVGLNRRAELAEIEAAVADISGRIVESIPIALIDSVYVDPSRWPAFTH